MREVRLPSFLKSAIHRSHLNFVAGLAVTEEKEGVVTGTVVVAGDGDDGELCRAGEDVGGCGSASSGDVALSRPSLPT